MSKSFAGKSELHNYKKQYNCESTSKGERMCTYTYVIWVCLSSYLFNGHCEQITFMLCHAVCKCNIFMCYPLCTYMYLPITHLPSYLTITFPSHTYLLISHLHAFPPYTNPPISHQPYYFIPTFPSCTYLFTSHLPYHFTPTFHLTPTLLPCQGMLY